ncbi:response regulator [Bacteroidetes/Chlorobi group bacterium Naka2016]|jgi:response regulator RpfG family c-di-GMP phosphodiesterase|nr:MAG: response regulator [Bacteroidetes/Chlorobi group bacterium Naka2016]
MEEFFIPFCLVEKSESTKNSLKKVIERIFRKSPIFTVDDGVECWDLVQKYNDLMIIVANYLEDQYLTEQLVKNIRESENTNIRNIFVIFITSNSNAEINFKALQVGADDFINKPFLIDEVIAKFQNAYRIMHLYKTIEFHTKTIQDLNEELRRDTLRMRDLLYLFECLRIPDGAERINRITEIALWIANEYDPEDEKLKNLIQEASKLCFVGRLHLPERNIGEIPTQNGILKNEKMEKIPFFSKEVFSFFRSYQDVADVVIHIYENYDGSGLPDKLEKGNIPLASRILRVVIDYDDYYQQKKFESNKIVAMLEAESRRLYDFRIVVLLDQYLAYRSSILKVPTERPIEIDELAEGMTLSRNIVTETGLKIAVAGTLLNEEAVERIKTIAKAEPIIGRIYIKIQ